MKRNLVLVSLIAIVGIGAGYKFWPKPFSTQAPAQQSAGAASSLAGIAPAPHPSNNASAVNEKVISNSASSIAYDPRLANLAASTDNPAIEYIRGEGGLVLAEVDNEPNNISYKKPLKEYQYHQGKVRTLTRYEYYKTEIVVTTIDVAYKPDGSILDYREQTNAKKIGQ
jgi:hypothetical protein